MIQLYLAQHAIVGAGIRIILKYKCHNALASLQLYFGTTRNCGAGNRVILKRDCRNVRTSLVNLPYQGN